MVNFSNIVSKTVGVTGMSLVFYDAYKNGKSKSKKMEQSITADYMTDIFDASRTSSKNSRATVAMQEKVKDLRMNNFIVPMYGKIKGFIKGFITTLGDNIIPVTFASLAIASKGKLSKLGAIGVATCGVISVLKDGFGVGKETPMS